MSSPSSPGSRPSSDGPRILIDRCISPSFAAVLRKTGLECISLAEKFGNSRAEQMQDVEWIQWAGANGYAVLTANPRMLRVPMEREAIVAHGTKVFCIAKPETTKEDKAYLVGRHILSILRKMKSEDPCFWRLYMGIPVKYDI